MTDTAGVTPASSLPSDAPATDAPPALPVLDQARTQFVEQFALVWATAGNPRMEGRIMGLLMILDEPYLSSTQIATMLHASAGAVSTSTRQLVDVGFLKRHVIPGDRNHYFRVEDDIWGSFLGGERHYLQRLQDVIDTGFAVIPGATAGGEPTTPSDAQPDATAPTAEHPDAGPLLRLTNARLYITWLTGYQRRMLADWQAYRDAAHAAAPTPEDTE
ncbi:GbsR/MarR family transcriptional regulator [Cellulomonas citrea]|uniref:GbsR/MarR family transcriptional regulator n=1 Tax=Cellulomonas citrea TaxID=1909423 RepID=UPI001F3B9570|nr:transcriptional regulator [Cellulomonas citrea]